MTNMKPFFSNKFINQIDGSMINNYFSPVLDELCHHFIQIPLGRFLPRGLRKSIVGRWPDAFSEEPAFLVTKIGAQ